MIPLLNILLLSSVDPIKNFVSLKTYISENAKVHLKVYRIDEDLPELIRLNLIEKTEDDFKAYLNSVDIECKHAGGYYYIMRKPK
jgi:gamma-glutamylcyclotransferase (GGCT)/AIG2-like uncharacterized protein YtfP